jgi:hypothetical protein
VSPEQRELLERLAKLEASPDEVVSAPGKTVWKKIKDTISGS